MRHIPLLLSAAIFALAPAFAHAADAPAATATPVSTPAAASTPANGHQFTDAQRAEIENIIKEYVTKKNPQALMEGLQNFQAQQQNEALAKSQAALTTDHDKVYGDPNSPVGGNPKGDVTVVEFFDYQCGYCKMAEPNVEKLLKEDKNIKFIYKEYPILGPTSVLASKAALASIRQNKDKYEKFHSALMTANFTHGQKPAQDEELVYKLAKDNGLDVTKLKKDMEDPELEKIVEANVALGEEVGARGTPTFIINDTISPGAMEYDAMKKSISEARSGKKPG